MKIPVPFTPLKLWEALPSNERFVERSNLERPSKTVIETFIARLKHFELIPESFQSLTHLIFNRDIDVKSHVVTVSLDMAINYLRACTLFKGQVISNPSQLVRAFLEEWNRMDKENYLSYLKSMGLTDYSPLPHQMPLMNFDASTEDERLANLRCWEALSKTEDANGRSISWVPNLFEVDYVCRVKGSFAFELNPTAMFHDIKEPGLYRQAVILGDGTQKTFKPPQLVTAGMDREFFRLNQRLIDSQQTEGPIETYSGFFPYNPAPGQMRRGYRMHFGDGG